MTSKETMPGGNTDFLIRLEASFSLFLSDFMPFLFFFFPRLLFVCGHAAKGRALEQERYRRGGGGNKILNRSRKSVCRSGWWQQQQQWAGEWVTRATTTWTTFQPSVDRDTPTVRPPPLHPNAPMRRRRKGSENWRCFERGRRRRRGRRGRGRGRRGRRRKRRGMGMDASPPPSPAPSLGSRRRRHRVSEFVFPEKKELV